MPGGRRVGLLLVLWPQAGFGVVAFFATISVSFTVFGLPSFVAISAFVVHASKLWRVPWRETPVWFLVFAATETVLLATAITVLTVLAGLDPPANKLSFGASATALLSMSVGLLLLVKEARGEPAMPPPPVWQG